MSDILPRITLAAVQAASVHLDRQATVAKACALIAEAGRQGADLIAFPEGFIPAHPCWFTVRPATDKISMDLSRQLFQNAVVIPSADTDALAQACSDAGITAVVGVCEKRAGTTGTMFNTQLFIGPDGQLLGKHRKLMPTLAEKLVHAGGHGDTLRTFETSFGRISGLVCGENGNPLAAFALLSHYPLVHVASWPAFVSPTVSLAEVIPTLTRGLAVSMGCFVVNSTGVLTQQMIDAYQAGEAEQGFMAALQGKGHASVIGPSGQVLTAPLVGEGIVYASVDLNEIVLRKVAMDFAGHYHRADVFEFRVRTEGLPPD